MMAGTCRITVEISKKSYDNIRRRVESSEQKTSRVLSRYLSAFFSILADGEFEIHRVFTRLEAERLASVLSEVQRTDGIPWEELGVFESCRLSRVIELYAPTERAIVVKVSGLGTSGIIALMEYAQMLGTDRFVQQTARFRS